MEYVIKIDLYLSLFFLDMDYCGECGELHNEKDCKVYMFHKEKYDLDKVFIDCDLCETPDEMYKIDYIHEMNICTCCSEIVHEYMSENDKIEGECHVCLEHTQLNMLPCKHNLCFDCCKHIYIGITESNIYYYIKKQINVGMNG